jgi:hypothetical protein
MEGPFQAPTSPLHLTFLRQPFSGVPDLAGLHRDDTKKQPIDSRLMLINLNKYRDKVIRQSQTGSGFKAL